MSDESAPIGEEKPQEIVVMTSSPTNVTTVTMPSQTDPGGAVAKLRRGSVMSAVFKIALGTVGFAFYMTSDKEHLHETAFLIVDVAFIAWGFHELSRQSLKNFLADVGRFIPWGKKDPPAEGEP
jgi:hypothetical protein